jgi:hypothetical protein
MAPEVVQKPLEILNGLRFHVPYVLRHVERARHVDDSVKRKWVGYVQGTVLWYVLTCSRPHGMCPPAE